MQTETTIISYEIRQLIRYINWGYFFHAWGFPLQFAGMMEKDEGDLHKRTPLSTQRNGENRQQDEAFRLYEEAVCLLNKVDGSYKVRAIYRLMNANSDGDDLLLGDIRIPLLRQQTHSHPDEPYMCLSDFVRPLSHGTADTVGIFATTIDEDMELPYKNDVYQSMLIKTLGERLAEAAAEKLHETIRKDIWGYAKNENLSPEELFDCKYQGIRPAVGYPSLPDLSVNFLLNSLIGMEKIGIHLTENGMMKPHASVCGFMISHPHSRYFNIGKIGEDQLADYSARRGIPAEDLKKYLIKNLQ